MLFNILNKPTICKVVHYRSLSLCSSAFNRNDQHWRKLWQNPNSFGPLTNLPDYTYMDGRPTPLGSNLKRRLDKQKEIAQKIVVFNSELDFAKTRYTKMQKQKIDLIEKQASRQLKPKGHLLNKTS